MVMLASDDNNPEFIGARNPDDILHVSFYERAVYNSFKSTKANHPVYDNVDFVKIMKPGDSLSIIDTYANQEHQRRFPRQWALYMNKKGPEEQLVGMPVIEWPAITRAQAEGLRGQKFYTVEQVAGASDLQIQSLGMIGTMLRKKAQAYLAAAEGTASASADAEKVAKLEAEMAQMREVLARVNAQANMPKKKPGRPKKVVDEQQQPEAA